MKHRNIKATKGLDERTLTQKQYAILKIIDEIYSQFGKFPTYQQIADNFSCSRQNIEQHLRALHKNHKKKGDK